MTNSKKKGNAGENNFANWLRDRGVKAYRNSSSGGNTQKSDVHNAINANFEVKTVKRINLLEAWKQSQRDANLAHSTPYLAIHFDGMPANQWLMVLHCEDWIDLVLKPAEERVITQETPNDRERKWVLENAKVAINKALKFL